METYQPPADLLRDRVILVTGAGQGLGAEAARCYAAHGATVVLVGETLKKLEQVYDAIEQAGGPRPAIYPINFEGAAPKDYEELAVTLEQEFGRLDGLLHNAASLGTLTPIIHYDIETWHRVLQVNLNAPFMLTRACLGLLNRADDASLIFTSDEVGRRGRAYWGAYAVSKFGLEGLMQILAEELEANTAIRVNSLDPGPVNTPMRRAAYPAEDASTLPTPQALMSTYLYLMGPDSRGTHGQALSAQAPTDG